MVMARIGMAVLLAAAGLHPAAAASFKVLHDFGVTDAGYPASPLLLKDHLLYGTTLYSDRSGLAGGTVFDADPVSGAATTLATLDGGASGAQPQGRLVDSDGTLYGTTTFGGALGFGAIFKLDLATGIETTPHSFSTHDGTYPTGGLTAPSAKAFYGVARQGGLYGEGTIYKFLPATGKIRVLYNFGASAGSADGSVPLGAPLYVQGIFYGTASQGGASGDGVVYRFDPVSGSLAVLHSFSIKVDGSRPQSGLLLVGGALYGTTLEGGAGKHGTVFKLDLATNLLTTLHDFAGYPDGGAPYTGLVEHGGLLYGTTFTGGAHQAGCIYQVDPASGAVTTVYDFKAAKDGSNPFADLTSSPLALFGTNEYGGAAGVGTIFKFVP